MTYDHKCYELARTWLIGENLYTEANAERLAQAVQDVCESEVDELKETA